MAGKNGKKVHGVGINDADYAVTKYKDGKRVWICPYYSRWANILSRCNSIVAQKKYPTYIDCKVCDEWIYFMNFRAWMAQQDWEGKDIDKDVLVVGNKIYSPETCVFVDRKVNNFMLDSAARRGSYPIGVYFDASIGRIRAHCNDPFSDNLERLGLFSTPEEAHQAWRKRKHELACQLADSEYVTDIRVANALRTRYSN